MILLKKFNIMIWFILIYVITLILSGVYIYIDMYKGETLQHYFKYEDSHIMIFCMLVPGINIVALIYFFGIKLFKKFWDKIKHWEK